MALNKKAAEGEGVNGRKKVHSRIYGYLVVGRSKVDATSESEERVLGIGITPSALLPFI